MRKKSLEFIVIIPVIAILVMAGTSLYYIIWSSVGEFTDNSIRDSLSSMSNSLYRIADKSVDELIFKRHAGDAKRKKLSQFSVFQEAENFARQNDIDIIIYAKDKGKAIFDTGFSTSADAVLEKLGSRRNVKMILPEGTKFYVRTVEFNPWQWRIILLKNAAAYASLFNRVTRYYFATALILLTVAVFLILYLRRAVSRPINHIVARLREGTLPNYRGIIQLEFLSNSFSQIMSSLQEKTRQLEATLESMSEGLTVFDAELRLVAWNNQFIKLRNYPKNFIQAGKFYADIIRYNIERGDYGSGDPEQQLAERIQRASDIKPDRFEILLANGSCLEISRNPMPNGGFVSTYKDITERKQAEKELSQHRDHLEALVSARTTELLLANQRLEESKLKAESAAQVKSRFLGIMGHELRRPLNIIIGFTRIIKRKSKDVLPVKQYENLEKVLISGNDLLALINDILDLIKLENLQFPVYSTKFAVEPLIDECLQDFEPIAKEKQLQLIKVFDAVHSQLYADKQRMKQILANLLDNAIKFTEKGKITVTIRSSNEEITISVADTGIGISDDKIDLLFGDFQQLDDSSTRQYQGTGLGLSICRRLARLMGGDVLVESKQGIGSTFTVRIPRHFSPANASK